MIHTSADEEQPIASTEYVAWNVTSGQHQALFARGLNDTNVIRVSNRGVETASGGIDGTTVVYHEYLLDPYCTSDLWPFDLSSRTGS